ncbi:hypothetical protein CISG_01699 [Coccidioides immitis RMSCC 3703]|uniref:Uncharacterized protein n=2 Tax=Coccidioides immitis TaxID=5501 RepID=A0A0J8R0J3_COCIT|nr:hypothetical protein CIRG_08341 [Coccidioides immitis RMSCC 2394]KMU78659.1 hypothetical protein CISG_01699 [Coccidioides immitis RMSCC 3703]
MDPLASGGLVIKISTSFARAMQPNRCRPKSLSSYQMGRVKHGMSCMSEKRGGKNRMTNAPLHMRCQFLSSSSIILGQINRSFVLRTEKLLKYPRIREVVRSTPQPHMCGKERGKCQTQLPAAIIPRVKRGDDVSRSVGTGHGVWDMAFARAAIAGKTLWVSLLAGRGLKRSMSPHSWRHGTWLFLDEQRSGDVVLDEVGETTLSDRLHEG